MSERITITSLAEKWRLECLADERYGLDRGHTNWFPIDGVFRCQVCAEAARTDPDVDPQYRRLRDKKTGEYVERDEILLAVEGERSATGV